MPRIIGQDDMNRVFEIVDALGISREAIQVPLATRGSGSVERLPTGKIRIVLPDDRPLDEWLPSLRERIQGI